MEGNGSSTGQVGHCGLFESRTSPWCVRSELARTRTIIDSGSTPFKKIEIITNSPEAKAFFEGLLKEMRVPGNVRIEP